MIDVTIIKNTGMEDVLAFKCCNLPDQNLEIHIRNTGDRSVGIRGYVELENDNETMRCNHLYPPWERTLASGETAAFYCHMESELWNQYNVLVVYDGDGNAYRFPITRM
jgi:hypothetical protein